MKIGIMGGTFDPIHNGHLMLGQAAYETFHLDQIWFMPNGHPPHKDRTTIESDVDDRIEMVRLAIGGKEEFRLELYEACRKEVSYSYSTLEFLIRYIRRMSFILSSARTRCLPSRLGHIRNGYFQPVLYLPPTVTRSIPGRRWKRRSSI